MYPLQEKFNPQGPITQVPLDWFESVAKILNYVTTAGDGYVDKTAAVGPHNPWRIVFPDYSAVYAPIVHDHDFFTGLQSDFAGRGTGIPYFDDATDTLSIRSYVSAITVSARGTDSVNTRRLPVFAAGTNVNAVLTSIEKVIGDVPPAGGVAKTVGQVLTLSAPGGVYSCEWKAAGGVTRGTLGYLLRGAGASADPTWSTLATCLGAPATAGDRYKVLQVTSTTGTLGWDFVRAY